MTGVITPPGPEPAFGGPGADGPRPATEEAVHWLRRPRALPPTASSLVIALAIGVVGDIAVHTRLAGVAGTVTVAAVAVGLVVSGRLRTPAAAAMAGLALPFGCLLLWRTSSWVVGTLVVCAAGLVTAAASFARGGAVTEQHAGTLAVRLGRLVASAVAAPAFLASSLGAAIPDEMRRGHRAAPVARGVLIAGPVLVVLGMLLASADAVFASFFRLPVSLDVAGAHVLWVLAVAIGGAWLLREASQPPVDPGPRRRARVGTTEATMLLTGLVVLYGLFALAQVVVAAGGAEVVLTTAGLTRADYARRGFFQLVAVAGITLAILLVLRANVEPASKAAGRRFVVASELAVALTLVIVGVAILRMHLYDDAYGLTALRLWVSIAMVWIGVVFVMVGVALARARWHRNWLLPSIVASAMLAVLATAAASPDAIVARRNLDRSGAFVPVDVQYLTTLSDDAVPALVDGLDALSSPDRAMVRARLCSPPTRPPGLWFAWNAAASAADDARAKVCIR